MQLIKTATRNILLALSSEKGGWAESPAQHHRHWEGVEEGCEKDLVQVFLAVGDGCRPISFSEMVPGPYSYGLRLTAAGAAVRAELVRQLKLTDLPNPMRVGTEGLKSLGWAGVVKWDNYRSDCGGDYFPTLKLTSQWGDELEIIMGGDGMSCRLTPSPVEGDRFYTIPE